MSTIGQYRTIVADPPWPMPTGGPGSGGEFRPNVPSRLPYSTMSFEEIVQLPVARLAHEDSHLYLWLPNAFVERGYALVREWGFRPSTLLVWAKNPMGVGLGGTWAITTEFVLFARRGTLKATGRIPSTWFNWIRQYDATGKSGHSTKPDAFQDLVESVSPGPYLELFARRQRLGWDVWGNEVDSDVELIA